ncbi:MAG: zinc ABC transporter substrate-binding protein, partial [Anaerolineales bacterium]|nr:zinc ABC transporter substrate-binding protein [Anaerolineales bacterium]
IWTSPELGKTIAKSIAAVLVEIDPQHADDYQANLSLLLSDIEQLQVEIKNSVSRMDTRQFMVFHPAWGYFADEFGLEQIPIEINGSEPSASELAQLIDTAKKDKIRVIFAQPEFSTQSANFIASEIGCKVILISPLAEDWFENLRSVSKTFADDL